VVDEEKELTARERADLRRLIADDSRQKETGDAKQTSRPLIDWDDKRTSGEGRI
jgi:hypothetical protein